jgi:hypothetical protein
VRVTLEISPEPKPEERAAIEAALRELEDGARAGRGAWWEAGLAESLDGAEGGQPEPVES